GSYRHWRHTHTGRTSFDHLVGEREQLVRYGEAERLRGIEIYDQQVFCGELDRQVGRLLALKNAVDVARHDPLLIDLLPTTCCSSSVSCYDCAAHRCRGRAGAHQGKETPGG